jgi:putative protein kinase ArgK-like GTPase of G3E family
MEACHSTSSRGTRGGVAQSAEGVVVLVAVFETDLCIKRTKRAVPSEVGGGYIVPSGSKLRA